jgi:plastocyanin
MMVKSKILMRMAVIMVFVVASGMLVVPAGFAVLGKLQIVLLDQEPFYFPASTKLQVGQPVQWENRSMQSHTITHDDCGERKGCVFHSGHLQPGEQFMVSDLAPGYYPYHCNIHPFMRGLIVVDREPLRNFNSTEL